MRVLIDIGHPAHIHFFLHPVQILRDRGHEIIVTSRQKEFALELLDDLGIEHTPLSSLSGGGLLGLGRELLQRNSRLFRLVRRRQPDVMAAIGGISIAQVGALTRVPALVFYDTENARLQNALTYPFASRVIVPRCYQGWTPRRRTVRYAGYHELSYLHPARFSPDRECAIANGLAPEGDTFFVRVVSWHASHDVGEDHWDLGLLEQLLQYLAQRGKVLVSSEAPLPEHLHRFRYEGALSQVHHVLAHCRLFVGESATMASECAVLGVPAVYAARTGRGYTDEQATRYALVHNVRELAWPHVEAAIDRMLDQPPASFADAHRRLLADTVDVAQFAAACVEMYPRTPNNAEPGRP